MLHLRSLLLSLLYAVHALPSLQHPLDRGNTSIGLPLFFSLEEASRIVDITYCVGTTGITAPFQCLSRCDEFPSFTLVQEWSTGLLLSDSCGYIAIDNNPNNKRILVAFRGTYSIANTIADLSTMPQQYVPYSPPDNETSVYPQIVPKETLRCDNCTVHAGFLKSWQHTRSAILPALEEAKSTHPDHQIHLIGHSLGGAVALLAALELQARSWNPIVTTFGEPRVGNEAFVKHVEPRFESGSYRRVTHIDDPVPLLPPGQLGYRSHASEVFIQKAELPPANEDVRKCHGSEDEKCIAAGDASKVWQLFFAHRDYFWRLGLCIKGGDPWGWKGQYQGGLDEL